MSGQSPRPPGPVPNRAAAIALAMEAVLAADPTTDWVPVEDATRERPFGWVTAAELIRDVLGTHHRPDTPLVRVHVHAVRRKLAQHAAWLESDPHRLRGYRRVGPSQN